MITPKNNDVFAKRLRDCHSTSFDIKIRFSNDLEFSAVHDHPAVNGASGFSELTKSVLQNITDMDASSCLIFEAGFLTTFHRNKFIAKWLFVNVLKFKQPRE